MVRPPIRGFRGIVVQFAIVALGMIAAGLTPPASGAMLAVPLAGGSQAKLINLAIAAGATIQGVGPISGSVVLRGEYIRLAAPLRARGVVLIATASLSCGDAR